MLDTSRILYSYNDVMIKPAVISNVTSRSECNPFLENGKLPIFTAPMSTVVNLENRQLFEDNHINTILPRNIDFNERYQSVLRGEWAAFSLNEFIEKFCGYTYITNNTETPWRVLIDIANGHMKKLYDAVVEAKKIHGNKIEIMVGNIANPETYKIAYETGCWGIRCAIGQGEGCVTASNTGCYYGIVSLLDEIYKIKKEILRDLTKKSLELFPDDDEKALEWLEIEKEKLPKIIADGGIKNFSHINKALGLGADYVMIGGLFASLLESAGDICVLNDDGTLHKKFENQTRIKEKLAKHGWQGTYKEFYGMASREGQIAINGEKTKTSEGIKKYLPIIGTVKQWTTNMADYLRSAMSYCNVRDIKNFNPENVDLILISNNTKESINK